MGLFQKILYVPRTLPRSWGAVTEEVVAMVEEDVEGIVTDG